MTTNHIDKQFTVVDYDEPHRRRRLEILRRRPEVGVLFGFDRRTMWVVFAVVLVHLGAAAAVQHLWSIGSVAGSWWAIGLISVFVGAILSHWLAMGIHECSHNLAAKRPVTNRIISLIANLPMIVPAAMSFHRYHIDHHTYLGVGELDTDLARPFEFRLIDNSRVRKLLTLLLFPGLYLVRGAMFAKRPDRWELLNLAIQIPATLAIYHFLGGAALVYLALSFWFGHGIHPVAAHFIHEHYIWQPGQPGEPGQETYSYYGPLNAVTFNVGYHYEHHDFMNIPGRRLPRLKRMLSGFYDDKVSHDSWTWVLWHYVMSPRIGPYTRIVRPESVHRESRGKARKLIDRELGRAKGQSIPAAAAT